MVWSEDCPASTTTELCTWRSLKEPRSRSWVNRRSPNVRQVPDIRKYAVHINDCIRDYLLLLIPLLISRRRPMFAALVQAPPATIPPAGYRVDTGLARACRTNLRYATYSDSLIYAI